MAVKIALVTIKPEYEGYNRLFSQRKWIPVYYPAHADPEISFAAARPHYHIAWNRIPMKHRSRWSADKPVWQFAVDKIRVLKRAPKIISKPCVIYRTRYPEIESWK